MKGAIASVEVFAHRENEPVLRLSLVVSEPTSVSTSASASEREGFVCRVALANLYRPEEVVGLDSVEVLARALDRGRQWLIELQEEGFALYRDRAGSEPYIP